MIRQNPPGEIKSEFPIVERPVKPNYVLTVRLDSGSLWGGGTPGNASKTADRSLDSRLLDRYRAIRILDMNLHLQLGR